MREAVIVIADLYLSSAAPAEESAPPGTAPALEYLGRFGGRERLVHGWRAWLARWLGRADLAEVSVAGVAAASLASAAGATGTRWIATPVQLVAGLTRLHLDRRGIVRLDPGEQADLIGAFQRAFAGSDLALQALGDGQLLLSTPRIAPLATTEPARCADGDLEVPQGPAAAPLLRLVAEIEMWLHAEPLNEARRARGAPPVTGLWLWGAAGAADASAAPRRAVRDSRGSVVAFGSDAWLAGLLRLSGSRLQPLPERPQAAFGDAHAQRAVLVVEAAGQPPGAEAWSLPAALAALDRHFIAPALAALETGALARLTVVANDTGVTLGRRSALKRWRRRRAGLVAFA